jgi:YggT family protein
MTDMKFVLMFLLQFLELYRWLLMSRILLSWIPTLNWSSQPWAGIYSVTEPVMSPFRRMIPPIGGMLDVSPIVLFFVLGMVENLLSSLVLR